MQYDVATPQQYLAALDDDWRRAKLLEIREVVQGRGPQLEECIRYKMLGYRLAETMVFQLNAQKGYVSLYIGDISKVDPDGALLRGVKLGKGCIRFSKTVSVADSGVADFVERTLELAAAGTDISCGH